MHDWATLIERAMFAVKIIDQRNIAALSKAFLGFRRVCAQSLVDRSNFRSAKA
jgi:hypothetical protein